MWLLDDPGMEEVSAPLCGDSQKQDRSGQSYGVKVPVYEEKVTACQIESDRMKHEGDWNVRAEMETGDGEENGRKWNCDEETDQNWSYGVGIDWNWR